MIIEEKEFWRNQTLERRYPEQASANHQETGCRKVEMLDGFEVGTKQGSMGSGANLKDGF